MKNAEALGFIIGALVGTVLTGVCVYFTKSPFSGVCGFVSALIGGWIGKSIHK